MSKLDRRRFIGASALAGSAALVPPSMATAAPVPPPEVTRILARYVVAAQFAAIPEPVRKEAARTLLNWVGCTLGGSRNGAVDIAVSALSPFFGPAQATVLGRKQRVDVFSAALLNGISSHVLDFDDTHLRTVIHPAGPVCSAILALSEYHPVSGSDFMNAMILGVEAECRIGNAVYPAHYDIGWHITGTTGVFGAAAAAGKLLGLSEQQMTWALSIAATQPVGLREMFGTMTKSFHPGRAAQNGLTAAFLASKNFTSSEQGIEAKSGWANVTSTARNYSAITEKLGQTYEISLNTYKPFACGIVIHPAIDGCIQLRNQYKLTAEQIRGIELRVHPLVLELTGKKTPKSGLEGKFSVYHAAAVSIVEGAAGEQQFTDRAVRNPVTIALRDRVSATIDPSIAEDQVRITITLNDGRKLEKYIEHAVGSVNNPMSDAALEQKFEALADGVIPAGQARQVMDMCWNIARQTDAGELAKAAA
ncbi:MAG TPA: MmgE/PrpD family protein [Bryobacteraceae bacterium]|nr:MmgE/PrpD family protein [Bryobacteraceae bacterium]